MSKHLCMARDCNNNSNVLQNCNNLYHECNVYLKNTILFLLIQFLKKEILRASWVSYHESMESKPNW